MISNLFAHAPTQTRNRIFRISHHFDPRHHTTLSHRKPPLSINAKTSLEPLTMCRLHRLILTARTLHHHHNHNHRFFAQLATAKIEEPIVETTPPSDVEGFPKPGPLETIHAIPRSASGKTTSAKERKLGRVPSIVFEQEDGQHGGNKRLISVRSNQIRNLVDKLGRSFFLSRLFELDIRPEFGSDEIIEKVRVLPKLLHLHAGTDAPLNVTFIRAPPHALLKVDIPLVFRGEDISPGLRKGAYLNTIERTVKFLCPPDVIPPYIDVDLSELDVGQKLVMGDLKVHQALKLVQPKDLAVCKITGGRSSDKKSK